MVPVDRGLVTASVFIDNRGLMGNGDATEWPFDFGWDKVSLNFLAFKIWRHHRRVLDQAWHFMFFPLWNWTDPTRHRALRLQSLPTDRTLHHEGGGRADQSKTIVKVHNFAQCGLCVITGWVMKDALVISGCDASKGERRHFGKCFYASPAHFLRMWVLRDGRRGKCNHMCVHSRANTYKQLQCGRRGRRADARRDGEWNGFKAQSAESHASSVS